MTNVANRTPRRGAALLASTGLLALLATPGVTDVVQAP
jgi:hypothetical protein